MTIEIRQLVIRAVVEPLPDAKVQQPLVKPAPGQESPRTKVGERTALTASEHRDLVSSCAREVMRRLQRRR